MLLVLFLWRTPTAGQEAVCSRAGGLTGRTQKAPGTQATCRTLRAGSQGPHGTRTFAQTNTALQRELIQGRVYLFLARRANAPSPLLCPRGAANEGNERRAERAGGGAPCSAGRCTCAAPAALQRHTDPHSCAVDRLGHLRHLEPSP